MGTTNIGQWDETICNTIACQHPPCWQSMRRIERGHPRILQGKIVMPQRDSPEFEDKLPTLKIVDLPFNYPQRERVTCAERLGSISKTISSSKEARSYFSNSTLNDGWMPPISVLSSERNSFPGLNSRRESHSSHLRQAERIQVANLAEFAVRRLGYWPTCGNTVVRRVPDPQHRFLQPEKPDVRAMASPRRVCVKELALESTLSLKDDQGTKRKIPNKVPTGGQPYFLHLRRSQKSSNKSSFVGQEGNADDSFLGTRQRSMPALHLLPQNEGDASLPNKRGGVLLKNRETLAAPFTVQKAHSFVRFEAKIPVKDKDSRGSPGQPKIASGGSLVLRHRMAEQLGGTGSSQDKKAGGLLEHSQMPPESAAGNCKLQTSPGTVAKRKPCMKFMAYKSNTARLGMEGCDPFVSCLSKAERRYRQYCEHLASRKEAALARREASEVSREPWPEGDSGSRAAQKTFAWLQSPDPPPPSPLFESSGDSSLGFTGSDRDGMGCLCNQ